MSRAIVTFAPEDVAVEVASGTTIAEAARAAGAQVATPCGGAGLCGGCAVYVSGEVSAPTSDERNVLPPTKLERGLRLGCRARALGAVNVRPISQGPTSKMQVVEHAEALGFEIESPEVRGLDASGRTVGAAVDLGTTTIAVSLVDLRNGDEAATASDSNPQEALGADVMSRVSAALGGAGDPLRELVVTRLEAMVGGMLEREGLEPGDLPEIAVAGNTAMTHFLLGVDPSPLAAAPYEGARTEPATVKAAELGFEALARSSVYVLPGVSAFVGGDVVADLLVTRLANRLRPALLVDLGTNGEIVLGGQGGLLATSTAAGPAFEGASIESGMRAESGAIERAWTEADDLRFSTVSGVSPRGICGSGLLDLTALLLDAGLLDSAGRLVAGVPGRLGSRVVERPDQRVFVIDEPSGIFLTQKDVRELQVAKAAVRAGIELLLAEAGLPRADVAEVLIAGGFGYHVRTEGLVKLGIIPAEWTDRTTFVGNAAKAGARAALVSPQAREQAERIAREARAVDLASRPSFNERFVAEMGFPPTSG